MASAASSSAACAGASQKKRARTSPHCSSTEQPHALYTDAIRSVCAFLSLPERATAVHLSRDWATAVRGMRVHPLSLLQSALLSLSDNELKLTKRMLAKESERRAALEAVRASENFRKQRVIDMREELASHAEVLPTPALRQLLASAEIIPRGEDVLFRFKPLPLPSDSASAAQLTSSVTAAAAAAASDSKLLSLDSDGSILLKAWCWYGQAEVQHESTDHCYQVTECSQHHWHLERVVEKEEETQSLLHVDYDCGTFSHRGLCIDPAGEELVALLRLLRALPPPSGSDDAIFQCSGAVEKEWYCDWPPLPSDVAASGVPAEAFAFAFELMQWMEKYPEEEQCDKHNLGDTLRRVSGRRR